MKRGYAFSPIQMLYSSTRLAHGNITGKFCRIAPGPDVVNCRLMPGVNIESPKSHGVVGTVRREHLRSPCRTGKEFPGVNRPQMQRASQADSCELDGNHPIKPPCCFLPPFEKFRVPMRKDPRNHRDPKDPKWSLKSYLTEFLRAKRRPRQR